MAGRISARLRGRRTDAARVADRVARSYPTALAALVQSAGAEALRAADLAGDIDDCAAESTLDVVGRVSGAVDGGVTVDRCRVPSFSA